MLNVQIEKLQAWNFSKYMPSVQCDKDLRSWKGSHSQRRSMWCLQSGLWRFGTLRFWRSPWRNSTFLYISGSFVFLHYVAWFFRSVFGARNFAWVQKLRNYTPTAELDLVWHCHILDMHNYAGFLQQLGIKIGHVPFSDEETNDLAQYQYLGCFSYFSQFYHSLLYLYISSFVFHLLIVFLSFLSVRSIYSSELCLECMLLLSCLECFTMLAVVVSFFLAFDPCLVFKDWERLERGVKIVGYQAWEDFLLVDNPN